jgi:CheY-like chemotaxis protein
MISKVVSVEDDIEIAELLRFVMGHPQIELLHAENGSDALTLIQAAKPDLILLDVMMPKMSGWEVYDILRANDTLKKIPIIMLSVMRENPERRRAFVGSDIDLYVTKPFDALKLRREVARMLGRLDLWEAPKPPVAKAFGVGNPTDLLKTQQTPIIDVTNPPSTVATPNVSPAPEAKTTGDDPKPALSA